MCVYDLIQFVWGSFRWLAYGYYYFLGDVDKAKGAYEDCIEYDTVRVDCVVFLSRLYLESESNDPISLGFLLLHVWMDQRAITQTL